MLNSFSPTDYVGCLNVLHHINQEWSQMGFRLGRCIRNSSEDYYGHALFFVTSRKNNHDNFIDLEPIFLTMLNGEDRVKLGNVYELFDSGCPQWFSFNFGRPYERVALYFFAFLNDSVDEKLDFDLTFKQDVHCANLKSLALGQEVLILGETLYAAKIDLIWTNHKNQVDLIVIDRNLCPSFIGAPVITKNGGHLIGMVSDVNKGVLVTTDTLFEVMDHYIRHLEQELSAV